MKGRISFFFSIHYIISLESVTSGLAHQWRILEATAKPHTADEGHEPVSPGPRPCKPLGQR